MNALLIQATLETFWMVFVATFIGFFLGVPLGGLLFSTTRGGFCENVFLNRLLSFVINFIRSTPYIILVVALIPLTRFIVGSSIGTHAATVPLSLAAVMLYCRMVEDSFRNVPEGLIEVGHSMGATNFQIFFKIVLPEALPQMVSNLVFLIITLIGFSAMAGAVGGGGLGDLAIRYGYQRYNLTVMLQVILLLWLMVQSVQMIGDFTVKKIHH